MPQINISNETYERIREQLIEEKLEELGTTEVGQTVMIRTESAGVHVGVLLANYGDAVKLKDSIRIFYWDGACSLSQLAMEGTKAPDNCKFAVPVDEIRLLSVIEVIAMTKRAVRQIRGIPSWKT